MAHPVPASMPDADSVRPAPRPSACGAARAVRRGEESGERQRGAQLRRTLRAPSSSGEGGGDGAGGCEALHSGGCVARRAAAAGRERREDAVVAAYRATQRRRGGGGSVVRVAEAGAARAALRQSVAGALPPAGASMMLQIFRGVGAELLSVLRYAAAVRPWPPDGVRSAGRSGHFRGRTDLRQRREGPPQNLLASKPQLWLPSWLCRLWSPRPCACAWRLAALRCGNGVSGRLGLGSPTFTRSALRAPSDRSCQPGRGARGAASWLCARQNVHPVCRCGARPADTGVILTLSAPPRPRR